MSSRKRAIEILLVEDSATDRLMTAAALAKAHVLNNLHSVEDGVEALEFLRREGKYGTAPRPDLILLDLNLPRLDGRSVLRAVKGDPRLQTIPVIVMTGAVGDAEVAEAYGLHANSFVSK